MRCSSQHMSCNQNIWRDNRSKNMLPSTGLLKYWLYPHTSVPTFAKNEFLFLHWWFTVLFSTEYFSCVLARSSLPLTRRTVRFIWYLANISLYFSLSISYLLLLTTTAQWVSDFHPPSFFLCLPAASLLFSHKLPPAPGPSLLLLCVLLEARTSLL